MLSKILKNAVSAISTPRTKLALIVRTDLHMSKGKTAAQCAHAAVLSYQQGQTANEAKRQLVQIWSMQGQPKIVLRVNDYDALETLVKEAQAQNVMTSLVEDAGHTQVAPGTATVLGLGPDAVERIDKLVAHLKLL